MVVCSPDQRHAVPDLSLHDAVHQLQCGAHGQLSTVVDVLCSHERLLGSVHLNTASINDLDLPDGNRRRCTASKKPSALPRSFLESV